MPSQHWLWHWLWHWEFAALLPSAWTAWGQSSPPVQVGLPRKGCIGRNRLEFKGENKSILEFIKNLGSKQTVSMAESCKHLQTIPTYKVSRWLFRETITDDASKDLLLVSRFRQPRTRPSSLDFGLQLTTARWCRLPWPEACKACNRTAIGLQEGCKLRTFFSWEIVWSALEHTWTLGLSHLRFDAESPI